MQRKNEIPFHLIQLYYRFNFVDKNRMTYVKLVYEYYHNKFILSEVMFYSEKLPVSKKMYKW